MASMRGLNPGAEAAVAAEDHWQFEQQNATRLVEEEAATAESLKCFVCSLAAHTGQQKPLMLL
jgi:hypothetical protein